MNKTELVSSIAAKAGLSKADSKKALDACVEAISVQLARVSTHSLRSLSLLLLRR